MVTIAANPSGIAATPSETAIIKISRIGRPYNKPTTNINTQIPKQIIDNIFEISAIFFCKGVMFSSSEINMPAIRPTSVFIPVSVTTHVARPLVITVEEINIFLRSAKPVSSGRLSISFLLTGTDSPVIAASSAFRLIAFSTRASAGTKSPASNSIMSPGTNVVVSTCSSCPSRITLAKGADIFCKASSDLLALFSCEIEIMALITTIKRMITDSTQSSKPLDT